jgi:RNA polymerase sigma-70 factor (ECF subfamily)
MSRFLAIDLPGDCLQRAAAGDRNAQRIVYEQAAGPVFGLVRRLVRSRSAAEDVFQDCMLSLLRHLADFRGEAPFGAWARQIALRTCLMHLRSPWQRARRALAAVVPGDEEGEQRLPDGLVVDAPPAEWIDLARALATLPEMARAVVWMHDVEGMTHEEIAAAFGKSVSFSKSQLSRAHAGLRQQLASHAPAAPRDAPAAIISGGQLP